MGTPELRAAVVGVGRLGAFHADKYLRVPGLRLKYVVDTDPSRAKEIATRTRAEPLDDYRALAGKVDLASVVTPSQTHFRIATELLESGIDILLEKPMTATVEEARELVVTAESTGRILQVGHLERFNPAIIRLRSLLRTPRFIECHRLAPFTERGTDVDVVLDLMIHDLDVILSLSQATIASLEAIGVAVLTDTIDVANARLRFSNGMIANLNSSRVAPKRERKIRFFQPDAYISLDYEARAIQVYRKSPPPPGKHYPIISGERVALDDGDPLGDEVTSFVDSVRSRRPPAVSARDGLRVIELCQQIKATMQSEAAT